MTDPARIVLDPAVLAGKPVIRGTRLSVEFILGLLADGWRRPIFCASTRTSLMMTLPLASPMPAMC